MISPSDSNRPAADADPAFALSALSIAGSDSCGGAGLQADLKTFTRLDTWGATVITAVTAQNTTGVSAVEVMPEHLVRAQLRQVLDEFPVTAAKTGMLANQDLILAVADIAGRRFRKQPVRLVVDPVMVATSGARLLDEDAVSALCERLLPLATLVTPNIPEAEALTGITITGEHDLIEAGEKILALGPDAVLLKGGHGQAEQVIDILLTRQGSRRFNHARLPGEFHGTGCVLSAAITAHLARDETLETAVELGLDYLQDRMSRAIPGDALSLLP